ncbi:MAG: ATP-binding protein [Acholeplasmatales bacterium]
MRINRDKYLKELIARKNNSLIKVITGIRRCGKSYLLNEIYYDYLISTGVSEDHIVSVSLDTLENKELLDANNLNKYIKDKVKDNEIYYVFLDEIQEINNFVPLLNGLLQVKNLDIYVTGSNSKFLSSDIVTEFRGRGDQIHVSPLSFKEFYDAQNLTFEEAFDDYLTYGGMPFILKRKIPNLKISYLNNLFREIYLKDIKERYNIRFDSELEELLNIISSGIGSLTSPYKLERTFRSLKNVSLSTNTIDSYLKIFEESFLVRKADRYDIKGKKYINAPRKYYFSDMGLRNARLNFRQFEESHMMENIIYNELIIRGYSIDIGIVEINEKNDNDNYVRKQLEIDFVANIANDKIYIQSAYMIPNKEKYAQEIRPFLKLEDSFKKILIVKDNIKPRKDEYGIIMISLRDFLLNEHILKSV